MESTKLDNYEILFFEEFQKLLCTNEDQLEYLLNPGVYGIHCFNTSKTLLLHSDELLPNLEIYLENIMSNLFESCPEINKDYNLYGLKGFAFVIIHIGSEWISYKERKEELLNLKKSWPYKLYKRID